MKKRILVIEDEEGLRQSLKLVLEDRHDLLFAETAEDAWELLFFSGESVDLIVTDIVLPGMDGLEFLKKLKEINPNIPAIVMTGFSNHERAVNAANLNISGYVQKPFDIRYLQTKIEEIFNNSDYAPLFTVAPRHLLNKGPSDINPLTLKALQEIHKNLHADVTISHLAEKLGISERQLARIFKRDCGMTPGVYTMRLRIEATKGLLKSTGYPVIKILELVGARNNSYFFNSFKRIVGMTPEVFRMYRGN